MNPERELFIIEIFRDNFTGFPEGKIIKSESPDFIIRRGPKSMIGIELVQLLPPPEHHYSYAGILKPRYSYEQLLMTIRLKENKRKNYSNPRFNELWLLIHFEYLEGSDSFNLNNQLEKWHFSNGFDRVFLFDLFNSKVYECCHAYQKD